MDNEFEDELDRRLTRMESPGAGGMVQSDLPVKDVVLCAVGIVVVSAALLVWAF